ncbi:hypothetical protein C7212DRAFT_233323, partial [Tuber magnatum]
QLRPPVRKNTYKGGNVYDNNGSGNISTKVSNTENKAKNLNLKKAGDTSNAVDTEKVPVLDGIKMDKNNSSNPNRNEEVAVAKNVEKNVNVDVGKFAAGPRGTAPAAIGAQQQGTTFLPGGVMPVGTTDIVFPDIIITNLNDINNANENQNQVASSNENQNQNPNNLANENAAIAEQNFAENNFMFNEEKNFFYVNALGDVVGKLPPAEVVEVPSPVTLVVPVTEVVQVESTHQPCITCPPTTEFIPLTYVIPKETVIEQVQFPGQTIIEQIQLPGQTYVEQIHLPRETIIEQIQLPGQTYIEQLPGQTYIEQLPGETIIEQIQLPGQTFIKKTFYEKLPCETVIEKIVLPGETVIEEIILPGETVTREKEVTVQATKTIPPITTVIQQETVTIENQVAITMAPKTFLESVYISEEIRVPVTVTKENKVYVPEEVIIPVTVTEEKNVYISEEVKVPFTIVEEETVEVRITKEVPVPTVISVPGIATPLAITKEVVLPGQVVTKFLPSVPTPVVNTVRIPVTVKEKEGVYITHEVQIPCVQEVFVTKEIMVTSVINVPGVPTTVVPGPTVEATVPAVTPAPEIQFHQPPKAPTPAPEVETGFKAPAPGAWPPVSLAPGRAEGSFFSPGIAGQAPSIPLEHPKPSSVPQRPYPIPIPPGAPVPAITAVVVGILGVILAL